ncbi:MAG: 60Kd inner membrane protein-domain-containing protein [Piptocephalis tieghemiana]|nr:MAG: 60Kd inner membrane protein-domain-containing protein [Piptocephalis tieghemiana]
MASWGTSASWVASSSTEVPYSSSLPIALVESTFLHLHTTVHLPWWASIGAGALLLRTLVILPLAIHQQRALATLSKVHALQASWAATLRNSLQVQGKRMGWSPLEFQRQFQQAVRKKQNELYLKYHTHPAKPLLLPMLQLPVFVIASIGLRRLCGLPDILSGSFFAFETADKSTLAPVPAEGMTEGGLSWFMDLTAPDPTLALPIAVGLIQLWNLELHSLTQQTETRAQAVMKNVGRGFCGVMVLAGSYLPSVRMVEGGKRKGGRGDGVC